MSAKVATPPTMGESNHVSLYECEYCQGQIVYLGNKKVCEDCGHPPSVSLPPQPATISPSAVKDATQGKIEPQKGKVDPQSVFGFPAGPEKPTQADPTPGGPDDPESVTLGSPAGETMPPRDLKRKK